MKTEISNNDLLVIRACKRNRKCYEILRRVIGRRFALYPHRVERGAINMVLLEIACDYDLIHSIPMFIAFDIDPKKDFWCTGIEKNYSENLTERLISLVACTPVNKFPRYPRSAWFRNKYPKTYE